MLGREAGVGSESAERPDFDLCELPVGCAERVAVRAAVLPGVRGEIVGRVSATMRFANATTVAASRNAANSGNLGLLGVNASDGLYVGADASDGNRVANVLLSASTGVYMSTAGSTRVLANSTAVYLVDKRIQMGANTTDISVRAGSGSPEGVVTAPTGSLWLRTDGSSGANAYLKDSGTGNTGWAALGGGTGTTLTIRTTAGPVTLTGSGVARRNVHVNRYAGNITFNLPTTGRTVGESFAFKNGWVGAYTLTVDAGSGVGHDGPGSLQTYDLSEGVSAELVWDGADWNLI